MCRDSGNLVSWRFGFFVTLFAMKLESQNDVIVAYQFHGILVNHEYGFRAQACNEEMSDLHYFSGAGELSD